MQRSDASSSYHVVLSPEPLRATGTASFRGKTTILLDAGELWQTEIVIPFAVWSAMSVLVTLIGELDPQHRSNT
jgi:hypothetical protein